MCNNASEEARQQQAVMMVIGCSLLTVSLPLMFSHTHWVHFAGYALLAMSVVYQFIGLSRLSSASKPAVTNAE